MTTANEWWNEKRPPSDFPTFRREVRAIYDACSKGDFRSYGKQHGVPHLWFGDALGLHALDGYGEHCGCCDWIPQAEWRYRSRLVRLLRRGLR